MTMSGCIYHLRPRRMVGTVLHPLNDLRTLAPESYQREKAKYDDHPSRRKLPETWLPGLECRWNDVIHCSSIHPYLLYEEWRRHRHDVDPDVRFFAISIAAVAHLPLAVMRPTGPDAERDIAPITAGQYREITELSDETRAWFAGLAGEGRFGAHFVGVPRVLVRGSIETSGVRTVRWSEPPE